MGKQRVAGSPAHRNIARRAHVELALRLRSRSPGTMAVTLVTPLAGRHDSSICDYHEESIRSEWLPEPYQPPAGGDCNRRAAPSTSSIDALADSTLNHAVETYSSLR